MSGDCAASSMRRLLSGPTAESRAFPETPAATMLLAMRSNWVRAPPVPGVRSMLAAMAPRMGLPINGCRSSRCAMRKWRLPRAAARFWPAVRSPLTARLFQVSRGMTMWKVLAATCLRDASSRRGAPSKVPFAWNDRARRGGQPARLQGCLDRTGRRSAHHHRGAHLHVGRQRLQRTVRRPGGLE